MPSGVYSWQSPIDGCGMCDASEHLILEGETLDLRGLNVQGYQLSSNQPNLKETVPSGAEYLIIVKTGKIAITMGDACRQVGPGSMAVFLPGESFQLNLSGDDNALFYRFVYQTRWSANHERGQESGGSFIVDWEDLEYQAHDLGGRRNNFDRPTALFKQFEMHTSTLNAGLTNHQAHTHRAEEMVLVLEGEVEMLIGENYYRGKPGDLFFIASDVPHSLRNVGDVATEYFAFQWQ